MYLPHVYISIHVHTYIHISICIYIYVYTHTHTHTHIGRDGREGSDAKLLSPNMRVVGASHESGKDVSHERGAGASVMSQDSTASVGSGAKVRKGAMQPGELKKNERLRKLEEELNGMAVTQELQHAYVDPSGRNRRPRYETRLVQGMRSSMCCSRHSLVQGMRSSMCCSRHAQQHVLLKAWFELKA